MESRNARLSSGSLRPRRSRNELWREDFTCSETVDPSEADQNRSHQTEPVTLLRRISPARKRRKETLTNEITQSATVTSRDTRRGNRRQGLGERPPPLLIHRILPVQSSTIQHRRQRHPWLTRLTLPVRLGRALRRVGVGTRLIHCPPFPFCDGWAAAHACSINVGLTFAPASPFLNASTIPAGIFCSGACK